MRAAERHIKIQELLESADFVDSATLRDRLGASEPTIRRDLSALERRSRLRRVRGGALALRGRDEVMQFSGLDARHRPEKERIGEVAARLVEEGQTVILDGGSTTAAVARHLADRRLQVITNSLPIAHVLSESRSADVTLTGGHLDLRLGVMLGPLCEQMLRSVAADVLIMGIGGITRAGLSNSNALIVGSERAMIEVARRVVVVADHTKFGRQAMVPLAPLDAVDVVVSDGALPSEYRQLLEQAGVELLVA
jgi:DeoR family transcriptional regulator, fructose operon transcriptional repressor